MINPPPQISVLNIDPAAEVLPHKVVLTPTGQRIGERPNQISVVAQQRHDAGALERLQSPHRGEQRQSVQVAKIMILGIQNRFPVGHLEREPPPTIGERSRVGFTDQ